MCVTTKARHLNRLGQGGVCVVKGLRPVQRRTEVAVASSSALGWSARMTIEERAPRSCCAAAHGTQRRSRAYVSSIGQTGWQVWCRRRDLTRHTQQWVPDILTTHTHRGTVGPHFSETAERGAHLAQEVGKEQCSVAVLRDAQLARMQHCANFHRMRCAPDAGGWAKCGWS